MYVYIYIYIYTRYKVNWPHNESDLEPVRNKKPNRIGRTDRTEPNRFIRNRSEPYIFQKPKWTYVNWPHTTK